MQPLIIAVDQGSSSTKAQAVTADGVVCGRASVSVSEVHPAPGWVEQDPLELWDSVERAVAAALDGLDPRQVVGVGLTNQRESIVLWDRVTWQPLSPLLSWQDRRTTELCHQLAAEGVGPTVERISGLPLDPMFSALKARWLLDHVDPDRTLSERGEICLGTVDSWLISRMTGEHVIEVGNASRTQLLDLTSGQWSPELQSIFGVPSAVLPRVVASDGPFPETRQLGILPAGVPLRAVVGDSHAALFGHGVRQPGFVKATYGTGSSVMGLLAPDAQSDAHPGMCRTIAWQTRTDRRPRIALEANIRSSGATLVWLARLLGSTPDGLDAMARNATSDGVYLVPAFSGLGAPYWDADAVGLVSGLTLAAGPENLARAAFESIAFQVADVIRVLGASDAPVVELLADGGASANDMLMQLQADLCGRPVRRSKVSELSALGAAHLAGLAADLWDEPTLARFGEPSDRFDPLLSDDERGERTLGWVDAVARSRWSASSSSRR